MASQEEKGTVGDCLPLKPDAICCIISPENAASVAIANGVGFKPSHNATYNGELINVMLRPKP